LPEHTCTALGALCVYGCVDILDSPADADGYVRDLGAWNDLYCRFESHATVQAALQAARRRLQTVPQLTSVSSS
jgi:hypothetical protein